MFEQKRLGYFGKGPWFGLEDSTVWIGKEKYLRRFIAYLGGGTLRLHKFFRGDDDRASHTHPWWFITFPLSTYTEEVYHHGEYVTTRFVKAWRPHFRPAHFEHIVLGRAYSNKPFWTFVISGTRTNGWGFYPEPGKFVPWRQYK